LAAGECPLLVFVSSESDEFVVDVRADRAVVAQVRREELDPALLRSEWPSELASESPPVEGGGRGLVAPPQRPYDFYH